MLFLPEACGFIGISAAETVAHAEPPLLEDGKDHDERMKNPSWLSELLEETVNRNAAIANGLVDSTSDSRDDSQSSSPISLLDGLRTIARTSGMWISAGGVHIHCEASPTSNKETESRVYNTHLIFDSMGEIRATYRKIHLFDVSIPNQVQLQESKSTAPGKDLVLCDTPIGK